LILNLSTLTNRKMYSTVGKQSAGQGERGFAMTRKSFQKGCLNWHNNQWTLLYWLKDHSTGEWHQKRESAAFMSYTDMKGKKAAREAAIEFLKPINELNKYN
jgi:hypothetical protein